MERFKGKVAVVTGAASGIGEAIVIEFLKKGLIVVGLDKNKFNAEAKYIQIFSNRLYFLRCDLTKESEIEKVFREINSDIGAISILINAAGLLVKCFLSDVNATIFDKVFDVNVRSLQLCCKKAVQSMVENSVEGHIININSIAGLVIPNSLLGYMLYTASKHAARALSEGFRYEITKKKLRIKLSDISPGLTKTKMTRNWTSEHSETEVLMPQDVVNGCIIVLDTPPNVLISEVTVQPIYYES